MGGREKKTQNTSVEPNAARRSLLHAIMSAGRSDFMTFAIRREPVSALGSR